MKFKSLCYEKNKIAIYNICNALYLTKYNFSEEREKVEIAPSVG